jgi:hypothetical protein
MSWKPTFKISGKWCYNAQAFATKEEAYKSAQARFMAWTMPDEFDAHESEEPVNYRWNDAEGDCAVREETA